MVYLPPWYQEAYTGWYISPWYPGGMQGVYTPLSMVPGRHAGCVLYLSHGTREACRVYIDLSPMVPGRHAGCYRLFSHGTREACWVCYRLFSGTREARWVCYRLFFVHNEARTTPVPIPVSLLVDNSALRQTRLKPLGLVDIPGFNPSDMHHYSRFGEKEEG